MKENYQRKMEQIIEENQREEKVPSLLLHSCCAPCSSAVLERLADYFSITVFYYNPNLYPEEEFEKRSKEQQRLIGAMKGKHPISFVEGVFEPERFYEMARGMEGLPEGGERCYGCYRLRLEETAVLARELSMDYFTTTLSISPLKRADWLNELGEELSTQYQVNYLFSDFKKKDGYKRSIELSKEYDLYRQNYCGCVFSLKQAREACGEGKPTEEKG